VELILKMISILLMGLLSLAVLLVGITTIKDVWRSLIED